MSSENDENGLFKGLEAMSNENHENGQMSLDLEEIDQSLDGEIDSSDLDDDDENDMNQECGFCQHQNAKKFVNPLVKQLYFGIRFCDKFCANRYHLKKTASWSEDEHETNPLVGNKNAKKKGVGQRKKKHQGKSRKRGGENHQDPEKRRVLKPKLQTASKGNYFFLQIII